MTSATYAEFLVSKSVVRPSRGVIVEPERLHSSLFPFQRDLTLWALRKGRAALFADTGLGKTRMQLEWARLTGVPALILAPLAVAKQTVAEATRLGIEATYARHAGEIAAPITVTNYERLDRFDPAHFGAVVLDESSILKAFSGVTKRALIKAFADTTYRLCCTATPAPNDIEELCNHAAFLGVMSAQEMRSTFFIADQRGQFMKYRLKRHAHTPFYRWLASWSMAIKRPSDLGYEDGGFVLPPLTITPHAVHTDYVPDGALFAGDLAGVGEQSKVRRETIAERVRVVVELIKDEPEQQWLIWCGLNDEADAITRLVPGAVNVQGSDSPDSKADALMAFASGTTRVLVTKAKVAGFGMNFQSCARMAFLGLGYSFESYYQAIRRCWRFGQKQPVMAHIVVSSAEQSVYELVLKKERHAAALSEGLLAQVVELERRELMAGTSAADDYEPRAALLLPTWMRGVA